MIRPTKRFAMCVLSVLALPLAVATCGGNGSPTWEGDDVDPLCRDEPVECEGTIGGACEDGTECFDGTCCRDKNCGDGMCTYRCQGSADCPESMACEHGYCFFRCSDDADCGPDQKCEHGKTICEYEGH